MNADEIKSALGQAGTVVLTMLTMAGVVTSGQATDIVGAVTTLFTSVYAAVPAVLLLVNIAGSIWRHWNMKKVPETAVVVAPGK